MAVADRFYTPKMDTSNDGFEVDWTEHVLPVEGIGVHIYEWLPAGRTKPHGLVHISHGAGEHARRYQHLVHDLIGAGYAVIAHDHLGHGRTGVAAFGLSDLGPGGIPAARRATREVIDWGKARYPGLPFIEVGHSWGSLLAQQLFAAEPLIFDAVVLSGTALALPGFINPGNYNAEWADDGHGMSWLTRDVNEVQKMIDDKYGFDIAQSSVWSIWGALQLLSLPPLPRRGRAARVPMLILTGDHDPLGFNGRSPRALAWAYEHVTRLKDVGFRLYPEARHEVYNELERDDTVRELLDWLAFRFESPSA
ncbi:alpha/beta hydrolase [Gulosibacter macacae]|uniref:Alpha/beta hydrolase n=1 Tax=Gulosibacter macacae TaxID=2488791 RepID=A0A3P3VWY6_9MICO|nr:alpha/beta hydrolase [Gulosibacter macacae]RRJ85969.1 alpha/beta hydrolase [Gulosibacter macacae]